MISSQMRKWTLRRDKLLVNLRYLFQLQNQLPKTPPFIFFPCPFKFLAIVKLLNQCLIIVQIKYFLLAVHGF